MTEPETAVDLARAMLSGEVPPASAPALLARMVVAESDVLQAVRALHRPDDAEEFCMECTFMWPCRTALALGLKP